jgi:ABC-type lipoprotein release transport system permease subunit
MAIALDFDGEPGFFFTPALGSGAGDAPTNGIHVVEGRFPSDGAADEIALNEEAVRRTGASVGDEIELHTYGADQFDDFVAGSDAPGHGPRIAVEVVGIVRGAEELADNPEPIAMLSEAFRDRYQDVVATCDCQQIVDTDPDDVAEVVATLSSALADRGFVVEDIHSVTRDRVDRAVGIEVGALWIASAIALMAASLIAMQALARFVGSGRRSMSALTSIGATRSDVVVGWLFIIAPAAVGGALGAGALAVALSPVLPRGLARRAVLDPGVHVDVITVGAGMLAIVAVTAIGALLVASAAARRASTVPDGIRSGTGRGRATTWAGGFRPPVALGVSLAIDPARDRSRVAAATAVAGLAIAIGGTLAVVVIEVSATDVLGAPSAFGADWNLEILEEPDDPDAVIGASLAEPIEALAFQMIVAGNDFTVTGPDGEGFVQPVAFDQAVGSMGPIIEKGRALANEHDAVLGASFAAGIGATVGDELSVEPSGVTYRVAGIGKLTDGDETDRSMVVTVEGLTRLLNDPTDALDLDGAFIRLDDDDSATRERLLDIGWQPVTPPSKVANLAQIGSVPRLLAIALGALGFAGALHALLVAVARRRGDLAVVRALGFTPRQARCAVTWQGIVTACAAIVVGIPLGVLIGRVVWKRVTSGVGAVDLVSIPWLACIAVPVTALGVVTLAAWIVGRRAATLRTAAVLRSE